MSLLEPLLLLLQLLKRGTFNIFSLYFRVLKSPPPPAQYIIFSSGVQFLVTPKQSLIEANFYLHWYTSWMGLWDFLAARYYNTTKSCCTSVHCPFNGFIQILYFKRIVIVKNSMYRRQCNCFFIEVYKFSAQSFYLEIQLPIYIILLSYLLTFTVKRPSVLDRTP